MLEDGTYLHFFLNVYMFLLGVDSTITHVDGIVCTVGTGKGEICNYGGLVYCPSDLMVQ